MDAELPDLEDQSDLSSDDGEEALAAGEGWELVPEQQIWIPVAATTATAAEDQGGLNCDLLL